MHLDAFRIARTDNEPVSAVLDVGNQPGIVAIDAFG